MNCPTCDTSGRCTHACEFTVRAASLPLGEGSLAQPVIGPLKASVLYGGSLNAKDDPLRLLAIEAARRGQPVEMKVVWREHNWWFDVQISEPPTVITCAHDGLGELAGV